MFFSSFSLSFLPPSLIKSVFWGRLFLCFLICKIGLPVILIGSLWKLKEKKKEKWKQNVYNLKVFINMIAWYTGIFLLIHLQLSWPQGPRVAADQWEPPVWVLSCLMAAALWRHIPAVHTLSRSHRQTEEPWLDHDWALLPLLMISAPTNSLHVDFK